MIAANHMLAGSLIVTAVHPGVGLPLAFGSHFLLDMLPHYSRQDGVRMNKTAYGVLVFDIFAVVTLMSLVAFSHIDSKWLLLAGGCLAIAPDIMWAHRFVTHERFGRVPAPTPVRGVQHFHHAIQIWQSPNRLWVEVVVFIALVSVFISVV